MFLTILWTIILVLDIIACALGTAPTWTMVFGPLVVLVVNYWLKYFVREE